MNKFHVKPSFHRSRKRGLERTRIPSQGTLAHALVEAGRIVEAVVEGQNLTHVWENVLAAHPEWSDATRGAVRDLAWTTLRRYGRDDSMLVRLVSRPPPQKLRALLLVAFARLETRPDKPHVTVDQAVEAVGHVAPGLRGFANGVLRNRLRREAELLRELEHDPVARLRHPAWWIDHVRRDHPQYGDTILAAGNLHPPMALRINSRVTDRITVKAELEAVGIPCHEIEPDALQLEHPVPVGALPGFARGEVSVQDAGAQYAARLLGAQDGERVLDACAAPGGKTAHILELADVDLTALDLDPMRLERVRENLARLGLTATTRVADAAQLDLWWDGRPFDRILADVPCSASGVARRHPDIKWHRREADIVAFAANQARIIDALWQTLAPGGTMLYASCSVFDEENGAQLRAFCARHDDARRLPLHGRTEVQLLPNAEHDGFYYAALRKQA